jgi:predicted TIM-barrel fold metal-dependent hydrolase
MGWSDLKETPQTSKWPVETLTASHETLIAALHRAVVKQ